MPLHLRQRVQTGFGRGPAFPVPADSGRAGQSDGNSAAATVPATASANRPAPDRPGAVQPFGKRFARLARPRRARPVSFEPVKFRIESGPENIFRRPGFCAPAIVSAAPENDVIEQHDHHRNQRPKMYCRRMCLAPAELLELKTEPRTQIRQPFQGGTASGLRWRPRTAVWCQNPPTFRRFVPHQAPRMGVAFTHDIAAAARFMDEIANGVTRGNFQFAATAKPSPWRSIRSGRCGWSAETGSAAMSFVVVCVVRLLPGAVSEFVRRKTF